MNTEARVVIGMDPHKRTVTIEVMTSQELVIGGGRFTTDAEGYAHLLGYARQWPLRIWAIEGCAGIGKHIADRLVTDGEDVVDVPAKLSARVRVLATGQGRKTDATDAHSIALVGVRMGGLRPVVEDEQLEMLRLCADRRDSLGLERTRKVNQLHKLLLELIPGGAKKSLTANQAKELLKKVRPTTAAGKIRKAHAVELVEDLAKIYARTKAADKELTRLLEATGTALLDLHGIGPAGAARLLVEVGDITRFPDRNHFASWTGTAPIDASSGDHTHHRLSRKGNRQVNRVLHTMAVVQLRTTTTEGRAYYDRKIAAGKTRREARRGLKRKLSDLVFRTLIDDLARHARTGPGGQMGDDSDSSATGSQPNTGSSDKPLPGPATTKPRNPPPSGLLTQRGADRLSPSGGSSVPDVTRAGQASAYDARPPRSDPAPAPARCSSAAIGSCAPAAPACRTSQEPSGHPGMTLRPPLGIATVGLAAPGIASVGLDRLRRSGAG